MLQISVAGQKFCRVKCLELKAQKISFDKFGLRLAPCISGLTHNTGGTLDLMFTKIKIFTSDVIVSPQQQNGTQNRTYNNLWLND